MIPRIFGCFVVGNVWLFILSDGVVPYSVGSGVKSAVVVLSVFIMKIISGGSFIDFVKTCLNELLGHRCLNF